MSLDVVRVGFAPPVGDGLVDYHDAWQLQRETHDSVVAAVSPDTVLLLEHQAVYTAGKRTNSWERPTDGTPVVDVDRGGRITWHGPGQIVGYPITRLPDPVDVVEYVRRVEQMLIDVCADFEVKTIRIEGRSGVWVSADQHGADRKVAAIGVRVARGATMHGFSLHVDNSLDAYRVDRAVWHYGRRGHDALNRAATPWLGTSHHRRRTTSNRKAPSDPAREGGGGGMTVAPEGRKLLRLEARNAQTPIERKPPWIKTSYAPDPEYQQIKRLVQDEGLHTVCQEAGCPNIFECWEDREATFLIGGDQCTRRCDFCQIDTGKPEPLDTAEPRRVAESVRTMQLRYATVTGVARDDLDDQVHGSTPKLSARSTS